MKKKNNENTVKEKEKAAITNKFSPLDIEDTDEDDEIDQRQIISTKSNQRNRERNAGPTEEKVQHTLNNSTETNANETQGVQSTINNSRENKDHQNLKDQCQ